MADTVIPPDILEQFEVPMRKLDIVDGVPVEPRGPESERELREVDNLVNDI